MADQIPPLENEPQNIPQDQGAELDDLLNQSFAGKISEVPKEEPAKPPTEPVEPAAGDPTAKIKEEDPKLEKKSDKPVEAEKPQLTQEQIEKLNPTDKGAWGAIKTANKNAHKMIEQKDLEIIKLKATIAEKSTVSQKELDDLKKEKTELEKYRAMVDIQADPEFMSKYDEPIKKSVSAIKDMIKTLGVTDEIIQTINFDDPARMEEIIDLIAKHRDRFTASKIERKIHEYLGLKDKRDETLQEHKEKYKETLETKKKESFAKGAENEGRMIKHIETLSPNVEFLKKMQPKENATPAEIEQANNHNTLVDAMKEKLDSVMKMKEPEHQAEIALAAVSAHWFKAQVKALTDQLAKAREELSKIAAVSTESPSRKPASPSRNGNHEPATAEDAINEYFSGRR